MTQEELDAMMNDDVDIDNISQSDSQDTMQEHTQNNVVDLDHYKVDPQSSYPPPPPTEDHKVVSQLDDVTRESEEKAGEVFDQLDVIAGSADDIDKKSKSILSKIEENIDLFEKLSKSFPNVQSFKEALEKNKTIIDDSKEISDLGMSISDDTIVIMDIMQYQDIHRQKIERVINVMRALSNYMNTLLEGKVDDDKRVSSAVHIEGDTTTSDVVNNDDIEALIASFGG